MWHHEICNGELTLGWNVCVWLLLRPPTHARWLCAVHSHVSDSLRQTDDGERGESDRRNSVFTTNSVARRATNTITRRLKRPILSPNRSRREHCFANLIRTADVSLAIDPSAAPPPLFRLARTKSGWRAGALTKIRLAAAGPRERRHITLLVSLSMEHVVSTASVVTVGYFGAHNNDNNYNFSTASAHVKSLVLSNV